jgi:ATP-dependent exoDNAse (exonuclease V) beta subunit
MMMNPLHDLTLDTSLDDGDVRLNAIDPSRSFIVQAPAGSGKTALLTQRFLALLATADAPEQVVAMTFTKKAAAEMRERVMSALKSGLQSSDSDSVFQANTRILARKVLERDQHQAWCLLQNPNRLRIRTLDSMNGYLVQNMPFLSRLGAQPSVNENNDELYLQAARDTLRMDEAQTSAAELLRLLNGRYARAENLLVGMLKNRDQWMRLVLREDDRASLQRALRHLVQAEMQSAVTQLKPVMDLLAPMPKLAAFAQQNQAQNLEKLAQANWPLTEDLQDLSAWRQLAAMVLTAKGDSFRKSVDKRNGFPSDNAEQKDTKKQLVEILSELATFANQSAVEAFATLKDLPDPHYSDDQWQALQHVMVLLKLAVANLKWVFKTQAKTDFIEIAQAAERALGDEDTPTDLALQLDYQLKHLLIDEFQDTSVAQFELLKKLLRGWQADDGRTLFIVGDPMQSIYRFREAEVGNFLQAWQGIGLPVQLNAVNLTVNFRSTEPLVDWFNQTFSRVFPAQNQMVLGAVKYEKAKALQDRPGEAANSVLCHWRLNQTPQQEADLIADLIEQRLAQIDEAQNIAVLGRSRSHLTQLAYQLKQRGVAFKAVELESLYERQEVQDALALCRALWHGEDRAAWLALLRTPFIGLSLADLYYLVGSDKTRLYAPIARLMAQDLPPAMSEEGRQRMHQAWYILQTALEQVGRVPFSRLVHQTWLQLGAASSLPSAVERQNMQVFFDGLAQFDSQGFESKDLDVWVQKLYAEGDSSPQARRVQLMTMHKSKGLQFDTVFLPSLGRKPRGDDKYLVNWLEFSTDQGEGLVLAPLDQKGGETSGINRLIQKTEQQKQTYEDARLLYVAATRAERQLHLLGSVSYSLVQHEKDQALKPAAKSLLSQIWPLVEVDFEALRETEGQALLAQSAPTDTLEKTVKVARLKKAAFDLQNHAGTTKLAQTASVAKFIETEASDDTTLQTLSQVPRLVGILVHGILELIAQQGSENWSYQRITELRPNYQAWLLAQGLSQSETQTALERTMRSIENALSNLKVLWSLSAGLQNSATELMLTSRFDRIENHVVDRTFIDQGTRWIIDYKTSAKPNGDVDAFVQQQIELYQPQLERYGKLFNELENLPQRKVLYFTELDLWVEV